MITTGTSEKGLEASVTASLFTDAGYVKGKPEDYDRDHDFDPSQLLAFLREAQPDVIETLAIGGEETSC